MVNKDPLDPNNVDHVEDEAAEELKSLTPEGYRNMIEYIQKLEGQESVPEAKAVVWTEIYGVHGGKLNLTVRSSSAQSAMREIFEALKIAVNEYNLSITPPAYKPASPPATVTTSSELPSIPAGTPVAQPLQPPHPTTMQSVTETIQVQTIRHVLSKDGTVHYLRVMGGKWMSFGAPCYNEVFSTIPGFDINNCPVNIPLTPPANMRNAILEINSNPAKPGKVIAFAA